MMSRLLFVGMVVSVSALGCGSGETDGGAPRAQVIRMKVDPHGGAPAYGEAPMPSDAIRGGSGAMGHLAGLDTIAPNNTDVLAQHLESLDGFGLRPTVEFFLDGALDPASVPASTGVVADAAAVVDIDEASPSFGDIMPMEWRYDRDRAVLAGSPEPGVVLREGTTYAAVLTTDLRAEDGTSIAPAPALAALADGGEPSRWRSTAAALDRLTAQRGFGDRVAGFTAFTTEHASRDILAARAELEDPKRVPPPELAFDDPAIVFDTKEKLDALLGVATRDAAGDEQWGWSNPTGIAHDHVALVATGTLTVPRFTRDEKDGAVDPTQGTFDVDRASGLPRVIDPARSIPVTFVLPSAAPANEAGYPVAIFGHGLGSSRHAILTFAEPLTRAGFAVVAIDMADFGSRANPIDEKNNTAAVLPKFSGDATLRDGFGDVTGDATTFVFLRGFQNLSAVRDSVRQSVLDLSQLSRLLKGSLDLSALGGAYGGTAPKLDGRRLAYLGESYGALVGGVFAAVEPEIDLFVLDVPGGGILDLEIASSPTIGSALIPLITNVYALQGRFDRFHPVVAMAQSILDAADPLTYAPHVLRDRLAVGGHANGPRSVLAIEVVDDELIPNGATHALARAMGLPLLEPSLHDGAGAGTVASPAKGNVAGQTAALVEYGPATHGSNWCNEVGVKSFYPNEPRSGDVPFPRLPAPIQITNPVHQTLDQVIHLLKAHQAGAPVIESTLAPVADFDGDGMTDAEEKAHGRDPYDPKH